MLAAWPVVIDEFQTIQKLHDGYSISRYGDGECKLMREQGYVREFPNPTLAEELRQILRSPHSRCLVGIPSMNPDSPKYPNWKRHQPMFLRFLSPSVPYYSSWITRPDSAPWIATTAYAESIQALWQGKKVALVCEPTSKLLTVVKVAARKVVHIVCVSHGAYAHLSEYEQDIIRSRADIALLAHGVSATCLAHRLTALGIQAIDLGSIGAFLARMLSLEQVSPLFPAVLHHPDCTDAATMQHRLESAGFQVLYCGEKA